MREHIHDCMYGDGGVGSGLLVLVVVVMVVTRIILCNVENIMKDGPSGHCTV